MADETIVTEFVVLTDDALAQAQKFRDQVDEVKQKLLDLVNASKQSFTDVAEGMKRSAKTSMTDIYGKLDTTKYNQFTKALSVSLKELDTEIRQKPKDVGGFKNALEGLVNVGKMALQVLGIYGLVQILRNLVDWFKGAEQAGLDFIKSAWRLNEAIQSLQRRGSDVTAASTIKLIQELRQEFNYLSTKELTTAVSDLYLLTRQFDLTNQQLSDMTKAIVGLSVITGKPFAELAKSVALFVSSGYGEALQRAGIAVNRLSVVEEARREGIDKSYMALTELQRGQVATNLFIRLSADATKIAKDYNDQWWASIDKAKAATTDLKTEIGTKLIPAEWLLAQVTLKLVEGFSVWLRMLSWFVANDFSSFILSNLIAPLLTFKHVLDDIASGTEVDVDKIVELYGSIQSKIKDKIHQTGKDFQNSLDLTKLVKDATEDIGSLAADTADPLKDLEDNWESLFKELWTAQKDYESKSVDAHNKYLDELEQLDIEHEKETQKIWSDYWETLSKIETEYEGSVAKAQEKYQDDVDKINKDTNQKIQDSNQKYHDAVLKEERDFQERLRKLREEFLFDLEGALRERDALQVLNLIRRYNLDKEQATREHEQQLQDLKDAHAKELEEIKRANAEKLEERRKELAQELEDLDAQAAKKRDEAAKEREKELSELDAKYGEQRDELYKKYQDQLADLKKYLEDRMTEVTAKLNDEYTITDGMLGSIADIYAKIFGPKGSVDQTYQYYLGVVQGAVTQAQTAKQMMLDLLTEIENAAIAAQAYVQGTVNTSGGPDERTGSHALGGTFFASKPTWMQVGEQGPERVTVTPLHSMSSNASYLPNAQLPNNSSAGGVSRHRLEVSLSPDLKAQVIDDALNEMAGVFDVVIRES